MAVFESRCTHRHGKLGRLADAFLDIFSLLLSDGGMGCGALVRYEEPEAIPHYPKSSWKDRKKRGRQGKKKRNAHVSKLEWKVLEGTVSRFDFSTSNKAPLP